MSLADSRSADRLTRSEAGSGVTSAPHRSGTRNIRVLHLLSPPDGKTRYIDHMLGSNPSNVDQYPFSWKRALVGRYDVVHVHWPENIVRAKNPVLAGFKAILAAIFYLRISIARIPVVRTLHNLAPHENPSVVERIAIRCFERVTVFNIRLNETTELPVGCDSATILHGHYRSVYSKPVSRSIDGRLLYFGIIRPYKGVENLIDQFAALDSESATLSVVGKPNSPELARSIREKAAKDQRVSVRLEFAPDGELAEEIAKSALVVLPYSEMHNSGAALLALSLDRPILAPSTPANAALEREVGSKWMRLYNGESLTTGDLTEALTAVAEAGGDGRPDLGLRDWANVGRRHADVYGTVMGRRGAGS